MHNINVNKLKTEIKYEGFIPRACICQTAYFDDIYMNNDTFSQLVLDPHDTTIFYIFYFTKF